MKSIVTQMKGVRTLFPVALMAACLLCCSCSTIVNGTRQNVWVRSNPEGASVKIDGLSVGSTPCLVPVRRGGKPRVVRIEKDGYQPAEATLRPEMDDWVVGNVLIGGVIGAIIDLQSGAFYKFKPEAVSANLAVLERDYHNSAPVPPPAPDPPKTDPSPNTLDDPNESRLAYLREMYEAKAMTFKNVRVEVLKLDIPDSRKNEFMVSLRVSTE